MNITKLLRKNIGTIVAAIGFVLLCILTFGDIGDILGKEYWINVKDNITSIGFMTIGLTLIQTVIKQGLAEQALQRGLNTEHTTQKYTEHKAIIQSNNDKMIYLPYFLQIYNNRHTKLRKREFLVNNNFVSEQSLYDSKNKKLIRKYKDILIHVTAPSIKWSTTEVVYNRFGRIITLEEYRMRRLISSVISSLLGMVGVTFLTGGLFFSSSDEPLWQKFVKLFTYILAIAIGAIFVTIKEYEKGAFGVPNELDEINQIWYEFTQWEIPGWVKDEVIALNKEVKNEQIKTKDSADVRTDIQTKQTSSTKDSTIDTNNMVSFSAVDRDILCTDDEK